MHAVVFTVWFNDSHSKFANFILHTICWPFNLSMHDKKVCSKRSKSLLPLFLTACSHWTLTATKKIPHPASVVPSPEKNDGICGQSNLVVTEKSLTAPAISSSCLGVRKCSESCHTIQSFPMDQDKGKDQARLWQMWQMWQRPQLLQQRPRLWEQKMQRLRQKPLPKHSRTFATCKKEGDWISMVLATSSSCPNNIAKGFCKFCPVASQSEGLVMEAHESTNERGLPTNL